MLDASGQAHSYYADFYLPDYDMYLDPKNSYYIVKHTDKIKAVTSQNNVMVKIIPLSLIKKWEKTGFNIQDLQTGYDISNFDLTGAKNKL